MADVSGLLMQRFALRRTSTHGSGCQQRGLQKRLRPLLIQALGVSGMPGAKLPSASSCDAVLTPYPVDFRGLWRTNPPPLMADLNSKTTLLDSGGPSSFGLAVRG